MRRKRLLCVLLASPVVLFALAAACIVVDGLTDEIGQADVGVVLGTTVEVTGVPSRRLQARLDQAALLYEQGLFPVVVVSGGLGREGYDEAYVMRQYLIEQGIPAEVVWMDREGASTYLTARNVSRMMEDHDMQSVFIVSQYFHVPRVRMAFRRFGVGEVYASHARFFELRDIYSAAREVAALCSYATRTYE